MNGFEKLKQMLKEFLKDETDEALTQTVEYLLSRADLEPKYLNESKSIKGLYDFIQKKAHEYFKNNWCYITNEVVYAWAVSYFALPNKLLKIDDEKINKKSEKTKNNRTNNIISIEAAKLQIEEKNTSQISLFGGMIQ